MRPKKNERGSLILVAMCFTAVIAIALASYITVCYRSAQLGAREFHSKRARYLAEVGLEEALWALNNNSWATSGKNSDQTWTSLGADKTLTLDASNPSNDSSYDLGAGVVGALSLTVRNYATPIPSVRSTATITLPDGTTFSKTFDATTQRASAFPNAVASAAGKVKFTSGGTVDSFNSALAPYAAVVAGKDVALFNAEVKGYVATYGNVLTDIAAGATVKGPASPASPNIDPSRIGTSAFIPFFPVTTPPPGTWTGTLTSNLTATIGSSSGPTENWKSAGDYALSSATLTIQGPVKLFITGTLSLTGSGKIIVQGPVKIVVTESLLLADSGRIVVDSTPNAVAEIFVGGSTVSLADTAALENISPSAGAPGPANLALYLTGSGSVVNWNSAARFDGVLCSAGNVTIDSPGPGAAFYGAILSNKDITFKGAAPEIHYDYALRSATFAGISTPYIINVLSELATER